MQANTTYLVFAFTNSSAGDSATFSFGGGSPTFNNIGSGSINYNTSDYAFGRWVTGTGLNGKLVVTFTNTIHQAYVQVIQLSNNNISTPIAQSVYTSGSSNSATANFPNPPSSGDNEVDWLTAHGDLSPSAPVPSPAMTLLLYQHNANGSAASYTSSTASQNTTFPLASSLAWGTIGVELNHN
jgi:hypothetical protein